MAGNLQALGPVQEVKRFSEMMKYIQCGTWIYIDMKHPLHVDWWVGGKVGRAMPWAREKVVIILGRKETSDQSITVFLPDEIIRAQSSPAWCIVVTGKSKILSM